VGDDSDASAADEDAESTEDAEQDDDSDDDVSDEDHVDDSDDDASDEDRVDEDEEEYEVEKITARRRCGSNNLEYFVRWQGWGREHDSWVARAALANARDKVAEYEQRRLAEGDTDLEGSDDEWEDRPFQDAKSRDDETPAQFAARFKVDLGELLTLNRLQGYKGLCKNANLKKGTVLLLPDGRPTTTEWAIEAILRQHPSNGKYEVKWEDYDKTTWEPRRNLEGNSLFEEYCRRYPRSLPSGARHTSRRSSQADAGSTLRLRSGLSTGSASRAQVAAAKARRELAEMVYETPGYNCIGSGVWMRVLLNMPGFLKVKEKLQAGELIPHRDAPDRASFENLLGTATGRAQLFNTCRSDTRIALMVANDEVVCVAILSCFSEAQTVRGALIHWIRVLATHRRKGLCTKLVQELKQRHGAVSVEAKANTRESWNRFGFTYYHSRHRGFFDNTEWLSTHREQAFQVKKKDSSPPTPDLQDDMDYSAQRKEQSKKSRGKVGKDNVYVEVSCSGNELQRNEFQGVVNWMESFAMESEAHRHLSASARQLLKQFALSNFKPLQLDVIVAAATTSTSNVVAHIPTGGGKTLIYQILSELSDKLTIVIGPLKALRREQVERARKLGIRCMELIGDQKNDTKRKTMELRQNSSVTLLFLTPEMWIQNKDVRRVMKHLGECKRIERVVLDEAHYVAQCDEDFRPKYRELGNEVQTLDVPLLLLTATITPHVLTTVYHEFGLKRTDLYFRGSVTDSLGSHVLSVHSKAWGDDFSGIIEKVQEDLHNEEAVGIVYGLRKSDTEALSTALNAAGVKADFFHAGRSPSQRDEVIDAWHAKALRVIVATEAFGLGIDTVHHISFVHHMQPPVSMSCLQQHLGRARSRTSSKQVACRIFWHEHDYATALRVFGGRMPITPINPDDKRRAADLNEVYQFMFDDRECRRRAVVRGTMPSSDTTIEPCKCCDACVAARSQSPRPKLDASKALAAAFDIALRGCDDENLSQCDLKAALMQVTIRTQAICSEVAEKCIFAALRLGVLREEKSGPTSKIIVKGPKFDALTKSGGVKISFRVIQDSVLLGNDPIDRHTSLGAESSDEEDVAASDFTCELDTDNSGDEDEDEVDGVAAARVHAAVSPPRLIRQHVDEWSDMARWLFECLLTCSQPQASWADISQELAVQQKQSGDDTSPLQRRFGRDIWRHLPPSGRRYRYTLSASVTLGSSQQLQFELDWPKFVSRHGSAAGRTKRIYRRYGWKNILMVKLPQGGEDGVLALQILRKASTLTVGGRQWHKPKFRPDNSEPRLIFYAVKARGDTVSQRREFQGRLDDVNDGPCDHWHVHPATNRAKTLSKLLGRCSLMTSEIVPTIVLKRDQIIHTEPDEMEKRTDGAGDIAPTLLAVCYRAYCEATGERSDGTLPSTLQGRIMGCKGTWTVNAQCTGLHYRDSQNKVTIPDPTPEQLTVEVCEWATDSGPAKINQQNIRQLEARMEKGYLAELLKKLLEEALGRDTEALSELDAAEKMCESAGEDGKAILEMLDCGEKLEGERVQSALRRCMRSGADSAFSSGKMPQSFRLEKSRYYMIIPDRFGLLEEDEM
jgi:RecQ family ATP-dependent DNA helicase